MQNAEFVVNLHMQKDNHRLKNDHTLEKIMKKMTNH